MRRELGRAEELALLGRWISNTVIMHVVGTWDEEKKAAGKIRAVGELWASMARNTRRELSSVEELALLGRRIGKTAL
jgi:hypothetical protein